MRRSLAATALGAMIAVATREAQAQRDTFQLLRTDPQFWTRTEFFDRQFWRRHRPLLAGRAIRAGTFRLRPGVGAEVGFNSNVFNASSSLPNSVQPAMLLVVTPMFQMDSLPARSDDGSDSPPLEPPPLTFQGSVELSYREWLEVGGDTAPDLGPLRNFGARAALRLDVFPQRTWQLGVGVDYLRAIQPGAAVDGSDIRGVGASPNFNRNVLVGYAHLTYAPGRGAFELRFGYDVLATIFDNVDYNNGLTHQGSARTQWRFLPRASLIWDGALARIGYSNAAMAPTSLFDATVAGTRFGMTVRPSDRIVLLALAGYQATFYERGDNADTVVAQAEVQWRIDAPSTLQGGFVRDVQPSYLGNYYLRNRAYVSYSRRVGGRFVLSADAGLGFQRFGYVADRRSGAPLSTVTGTDVNGRLSTVRVDGSIFTEFRLGDLLSVNASVRGEAQLSDVKFGLQQIPFDWTRFEAYLGARVAW